MKIKNLFIPAVIAHSQANIDNKIYRAVIGALVKIANEVERQGNTEAGALGGFTLPTERLQKSESEIRSSEREISRERNNLQGYRVVAEVALDVTFACVEAAIDLKELVAVTIPQQLRDGSGMLLRSSNKGADEASAALDASKAAARTFEREVDNILREEIREALYAQED